MAPPSNITEQFVRKVAIEVAVSKCLSSTMLAIVISIDHILKEHQEAVSICLHPRIRFELLFVREMPCQQNNSTHLSQEPR